MRDATQPAARRGLTLGALAHTLTSLRALLARRIAPPSHRPPALPALPAPAGLDRRSAPRWMTDLPHPAPSWTPDLVRATAPHPASRAAHAPHPAPESYPAPGSHPVSGAHPAEPWPPMPEAVAPAMPQTDPVAPPAAVAPVPALPAVPAAALVAVAPP
ncbi:DNA translocase FtsK, partial [Methylobacterium isbiliense]|nr:DNA translocase FtsK [Methylobacterium isbiliense]